MISANGVLPAHRYTPQVTQRWPWGSKPASRRPKQQAPMWRTAAQRRHGRGSVLGFQPSKPRRCVNDDCAPVVLLRRPAVLAGPAWNAGSPPFPIWWEAQCARAPHGEACRVRACGANGTCGPAAAPLPAASAPHILLFVTPSIPISFPAPSAPLQTFSGAFPTSHRLPCVPSPRLPRAPNLAHAHPLPHFAVHPGWSLWPKGGGGLSIR